MAMRRRLRGVPTVGCAWSAWEVGVSHRGRRPGGVGPGRGPNSRRPPGPRPLALQPRMWPPVRPKTGPTSFLAKYDGLRNELAMKVEDTEQALTEAVCSRVREHLGAADADLAEAFARQLYRWVAAEDVAERDPLDLYGLALGHFNYARERMPGTPKVRVYNPRFEEHGWQSTHTAVEIVTDDMPFLIDSVSIELNRRGFGVHLIIHPVLGVHRDDSGELLEILPQPPSETPEEGVIAESVIHAEVARQTDPAKLRELELHLERVIGEVRSAVEDWPAMRSRALDVAAELRNGSATRAARRSRRPRPSSSGSRTTTSRSWDIATRREAGLGILRDSGDGDPAGGLAQEPGLLTLTKANARSTVHRPSYLDYVGVASSEGTGGAALPRALHAHGLPGEPGRHPNPPPQGGDGARAGRLPAGEPQREGAARDPRHLPARRAVPDLRRRALRGRDGDPPPRGAPAAATVRPPRPVRALLLDARLRSARPLQHGEPAPHRGDPAQRHQRGEHRLHDARVRVRARAPPLHGLRGARPDARVRRPRGRDDARGRHALVGRRPPGGARRASSARRAAASCSAATRRPSRPPTAPTGSRAPRSPTSCTSRSCPSTTGSASASTARSRPARACCAPSCSAPGRALTLSDVLPLFENMGVEVADERPYAIVPRGADGVWIYDFGLTYTGEGELDADGVRDSFQDAFVRAWRGEVENDGYNRSCWARRSPGARSPCCARSASTCARRASRSATATWSGRSWRTRRSRGCWSRCSRRASTRGAAPRGRRGGGGASRRRWTPSRAWTRTGSCAGSST